MLLAELANASNDIILVIRRVTHNFGLANSRLSLGEVISAVVEALVDSEKLLRTVYVFAEVHIVNLIDVAFVHVTAQDGLEDVLGSADPKQIEYTKELVLSYVAIASDVVVLKHRFEVNSLVFDSSFVLFENLVNLVLILFTSQVFAAGEKSVTRSHCCDSCRRRLINTSDRKGSIHVCTEVNIAEEALWVCCFVLLG